MLFHMHYFYFQVDFPSHWVGGWWAASHPRGGLQNGAKRSRQSAGLYWCGERGEHGDIAASEVELTADTDFFTSNAPYLLPSLNGQS